MGLSGLKLGIENETELHNTLQVNTVSADEVGHNKVPGSAFVKTSILSPTATEKARSANRTGICEVSE